MSIVRSPQSTPSLQLSSPTRWVSDLVSDTSNAAISQSIDVRKTMAGYLVQSPQRAVALRPSQTIAYPVHRTRRTRESLSPRLIAKDLIDYKKRQAILLARAIRDRVKAEEIEAIVRAEEEVIIEESNDDSEHPLSGKRALQLARATQNTIRAAQQTALCRLQVAQLMMNRLQDHVEEANAWVRTADMQVGEILELLVSSNYDGLEPEDFDPMLKVTKSGPRLSTFQQDSFLRKLQPPYNRLTPSLATGGSSDTDYSVEEEEEEEGEVSDAEFLDATS